MLVAQTAPVSTALLRPPAGSHLVCCFRQRRPRRIGRAKRQPSARTNRAVGDDQPLNDRLPSSALPVAGVGPLDRRSPQPLYAQLKDVLAQRIRRGQLTPGTLLPSERELALHCGVSTITARRVMAELAREGLVERRRGVGSFVRAEAGRKRITLLIFEFKEAPQLGHRMIASAFGELVGGVAEAAWEANAALGLAFLSRPEELAAWLDRAAADRSCDGLLIRAAGDVTAAEVNQLEASGLPYVLVKRHVPGRCVSCVIADERAAVRLAVEHLVGQGHRRIGFAASTQSRVLYEERLGGYLDALAAAGLTSHPRLICPAPDFSAESGEEAARRLLGQPPRERPTALMVASDSMAIGAYEAAAQWGLAIPAGLSIASVDDVPEARALRPPLTTARTSHVEFGSRAVRLLLKVIEAHWQGHPLPPQEDVIEPTLVVRESTAPPAAGVP